MKKKNGFIATSLMFSFFTIFLTLTVLIIASYTHYNSMLNSLNSGILDDLNNNVIAKKYVTLRNSVTNGNFDSNSSWSYSSGSGYRNDSENHSRYAKMAGTSYTLTSAAFSKRLTAGRRKIYVRFDLFRNGLIDSLSLPQIQIRNNNTMMTYADYWDIAILLTGDYSNWRSWSYIKEVTVPSSGNQTIYFHAENLRSPLGQTKIDTLFTGIDNVMVIDVTDAYSSVATSDYQVRDYLDKNVPYFKDTYSIKKI